MKIVSYLMHHPLQVTRISGGRIRLRCGGRWVLGSFLLVGLKVVTSWSLVWRRWGRPWRRYRHFDGNDSRISKPRFLRVGIAGEGSTVWDYFSLLRNKYYERS